MAILMRMARKRHREGAPAFIGVEREPSTLTGIDRFIAYLVGVFVVDKKAGVRLVQVVLVRAVAHQSVNHSGPGTVLRPCLRCFQQSHTPPASALPRFVVQFSHAFRLWLFVFFLWLKALNKA